MFRMIAIFTGAAVSLALGGCEPTRPAAVDVPGGTLGLVDDRASALSGAGVGLLSAGEVDAYLARQEAIMQTTLRGTGAIVMNRGDRLVVILPGNVTFDTDSARIRGDFVGPLGQISQVLQEYPESFIDLIGHTDSRGSVEYNQRLSEDRALAVADFLRSQGIYPGRIASFGLGETQPIATNDSDAGRQQNRRVEIVIIPAIA
ncbi:MAG: OmpA family protein [Pikeienuella sp.]